MSAVPACHFQFRSAMKSSSSYLPPLPSPTAPPPSIIIEPSGLQPPPSLVPMSIPAPQTPSPSSPPSPRAYLSTPNGHLYSRASSNTTRTIFSPSIVPLFQKHSAHLDSPLFGSLPPSPPSNSKIHLRVGPYQHRLPPLVVPQLLASLSLLPPNLQIDTQTYPLGARAKNVPLPYAIAITGVNHGDSITVSGMADMWMVTMIGDTYHVQEGEEEVDIMFWAAPRGKRGHICAGGVQVVIKGRKATWSKVIQLEAQLVDGRIAVQRVGEEQRKRVGDTIVKFQGEKRIPLIIWNESEGDAPVWVEVDVHDGGGGVFGVEADEEKMREGDDSLATVIVGGGNKQVAISCDITRGEGRIEYLGCALVKLGGMIREFEGIDRELWWSYDHVIAISCDGEGEREEFERFLKEEGEEHVDNILPFDIDVEVLDGERLDQELLRRGLEQGIWRMNEKIEWVCPDPSEDEEEGEEFRASDQLDFEAFEKEENVSGDVVETEDQERIVNSQEAEVNQQEKETLQSSTSASDASVGTLKVGQPDERADDELEPLTEYNPRKLLLSQGGEGPQEDSDDDTSIGYNEIDETGPRSQSLKEKDVQELTSPKRRRSLRLVEVDTPAAATQRVNARMDFCAQEQEDLCAVGKGGEPRYEAKTPFGKLIGYGEDQGRTPYGKLVGYSPPARNFGSVAQRLDMEEDLEDTKDVAQESDADILGGAKKNISQDISAGIDIEKGAKKNISQEISVEIDIENVPPISENRKDVVLPLSPTESLSNASKYNRRTSQTGKPPQNEDIKFSGNTAGGAEFESVSLDKNSIKQISVAGSLQSEPWILSGNIPLSPRQNVTTEAKPPKSPSISSSKCSASKPPRIPLRPGPSSSTTSNSRSVPTIRGAYSFQDYQRSDVSSMEHGSVASNMSLRSVDRTGLVLKTDQKYTLRSAFIKDLRPRIRMPRKVQKDGLVVPASRGSVVLAIANGTNSNIQVTANIDVGASRSPCYVSPSTVVLKGAQQSQFVVIRNTDLHGRFHLVLTCRSSRSQKSKTVYRVPLLIEESRKPGGHTAFSTNRPSITFYNPTERQDEMNMRVFNGTKKHCLFHAWIGRRGQEESGIATQFSLNGDSVGTIKAKNYKDLSIKYNKAPMDEAVYHYDELNIMVESRVERIPLFGYSGGADVGVSLSGKRIQAVNRGSRYGYVLVSGDAKGMGDVYMRRVVVPPGEGVWMDIDREAFVWTGDEIARARFKKMVDRGVRLDKEGRKLKDLFDVKFEGEEEAREKERLDFRRESRYSLHYAARMLQGCGKKYRLSMTNGLLQLRELVGEEKAASWSVETDASGKIWVRNHDLQRDLAFIAEGMEPTKGRVNAMGDLVGTFTSGTVVVDGRGKRIVL